MNSIPLWLKKRLSVNKEFFDTKKALSDLSVNTVCESAVCPNLNECFSSKFVTFMILGKVCTRSCAFCSVKKGEIAPVDPLEPVRIANCVKRLGIRHVIVTSVTRDDLDDGGAREFVRTVEAVRSVSPDATIELLISDFAGNKRSQEIVARSGADIVGHNIETVKRLYPIVRRQADYARSLDVLKFVKDIDAGIVTKSAILAGMGEAEEEIVRTMTDLKDAGCDILTIGQYLSPSKDSHNVDRFVAPEEFERLKIKAEQMGFRSVSSGPFVRSSYFAEDRYKEMEGLDGKYCATAVS